MGIKKIPMRMCSVTRERFPKSELIRVVKTPLDEIRIDLTGKLNGHGAYIKKDLEVLDKAKKTKALSRALECEIPSNVYNKIEEIIKESSYENVFCN